MAAEIVEQRRALAFRYEPARQARVRVSVLVVRAGFVRAGVMIAGVMTGGGIGAGSVAACR